jgi:hypothetical protein
VPAREQVGLQPALQPVDGIDRLRLIGRVDFHDAGLAVHEAGQQVGFEVGAQLVLARLAAHHHHDGVAVPQPDRIQDGLPGLHLVGSQPDARAARGEAGEAARDVVKQGGEVHGGLHS